MLKSLKNFFSNTDNTISKAENNDLEFLCGLMIEAANVDGKIDQAEIDKISHILINNFKEDSTCVHLELKKCLDEIKEHKSLHFFTSNLNKSFSKSKKILLIEILWEIILADGIIHDFESNLIRRLAGLLYISDVECGRAKQKTIEKLKLKI